VVDGILSHQAYLGGDHFTFGDIPMALIAHRWFSLPIADRPSLPHFKHWYEGIVARPGFARSRRPSLELINSHFAVMSCAA